MSFKTVAQKIHKYLIGLKVKPSGKNSVSFSIPLGSGYDVQATQEAKREVRRKLLQIIVTADLYKSRVILGRLNTFCNQAVEEDAKASGCHDLNGMLANEMVDFALNSDDFKVETNIDEIIRHVNEGRFAFSGKKYIEHGHVTSIYPGFAMFSGSWNKKVPQVAHCGKPGTNGIKKESSAYPVKEGEPYHFLYRPDSE